MCWRSALSISNTRPACPFGRVSGPCRNILPCEFLHKSLEKAMASQRIGAVAQNTGQGHAYLGLAVGRTAICTLAQPAPVMIWLFIDTRTRAARRRAPDPRPVQPSKLMSVSGVECEGFLNLPCRQSFDATVCNRVGPNQPSKAVDMRGILDVCVPVRF